MKIEIEIDDLVGYQFKSDENEVIRFEDMVWTHAYYGTWVATASENPLYEESDSVPAWSLDRLIEMFLNSPYYLIESIEFETDDEEDVYTKTIRQFEWLIKKGYFNKKYLCEK